MANPLEDAVRAVWVQTTESSDLARAEAFRALLDAYRQNYQVKAVSKPS